MPNKLSQLDDQELLIQIRLGDEAAFGELYDRYSSPLYNYLLRLTSEQNSADELLQEVFLGCWRSARRFRGDSTVKTWLFRIAHHKSASWLRKHTNRNPAVSLDETALTADLDALPEQLTIDSWESGQILTAVNQLSPKHRAVIELSFVHQFSYPEIAEILRCPVGTIKSRVSYALRILEGELRRREIDG